MTNSNFYKSFLLVLLMVALAGCATPPSSTPTALPTPSPAPTATIVPTATPKFIFDIEKFHNFPQSYEYLLAHPEEFVQSPDPLTDRASFDRWWNEEFIPAVGVVTHERGVDIIAGSYSVWGNQVEVGRYWDKTIQYLSLPQFFYFENQGTIYAVPVFNIQTLDYTPGKTNVTMAVILCDTRYWDTTSSLSRVAAGESFNAIEIATVRWGDYVSVNQFVDAGFIPKGDINDPKMPPLFGPGRIRYNDNFFTTSK